MSRPVRKHMHLAIAVVLLIFASAFVHGQSPRLDEDGLPLTTCPAATSRDPLIANRITTIDRGKKKTVGDLSILREGRNLLLDCDSYPRYPAELVGPPTVDKQGGEWRIRFELDRFDDVAVRAKGPEGKILHNIACGVLGPNAPEPFEKGSLTQEIAWDGTDAAGRPLAGEYSIEVAVGLAPRLEKFVAYDPAQLSPYLSGLTVDRKGRVYVTLHTAHRYDPSMLRFNRKGEYLEMLYPPNPDHLAAQGKTWEDVYDLVEYIDGYPTPIKPSHWRTWFKFWDDYYSFPFKIGPDGKGYFFIHMPNAAGTPISQDDYEDIERLDVFEDLDNFWLWAGSSHPCPYAAQYLNRHDAGFAFDGKGHIIAGTKACGNTHGPNPKGGLGGTIRKIDIATGKAVAAFRHAPGNSEEEPGCFLRPPWTLNVKGTLPGNQTYIDGMQKRSIRDGEEVIPDPEFDSPDRFCDIESIAVDQHGNILVADGYPRRIKCYSEDGRWLGEVDGLTIGGEERQFLDLIELQASGEYLYVLSTLRDNQDGPAYLMKCAGTAPSLEVIWSVPLDPRARFIGVDTNASPRLVWVGNGGGEATFSSIIDQGDAPGEVKHFGGIGQVLVDPAAFTVDPQHTLFVYDKAREAILKVAPDDRIVARRELNKNQMAEYYRRYRRFPFHDHHKLSAYGDGTRKFYQLVTSMVHDAKRGLLWAAYNKGSVHLAWDESAFASDEQIVKPFPMAAAYDVETLQKELQRLCDPLETEMSVSPLQQHMTGRPGNIGGIDSAGNLLCRLGLDMARRPGKGTYAGSISTYLVDADKLAAGSVCELYSAGAVSMARDSHGNYYTIDGPSWPETRDGWGFRFGYSFPSVGMNFWSAGSRVGDEAYSRGETIITRENVPGRTTRKKVTEQGPHTVLHQSEVGYVVKFGPDGGNRGTEAEQWALRGAYFGQTCGACDGPKDLLGCDGADRIIHGNVDHSRVKVVDTAGNVITRFGRYGNAETVPGPDGDASELGFRNIYCVDAAGEYVYVGDRDLRRIARVRMAYRQVRRVALP